jgi:hypothetical protein
MREKLKGVAFERVFICTKLNQVERTLQWQLAGVSLLTKNKDRLKKKSTDDTCRCRTRQTNRQIDKQTFLQTYVSTNK